MFYFWQDGSLELVLQHLRVRVSVWGRARLEFISNAINVSV